MGVSEITGPVEAPRNTDYTGHSSIWEAILDHLAEAMQIMLRGPGKRYSPPEADIIWLWVYSNKTPDTPYSIYLIGTTCDNGLLDTSHRESTRGASLGFRGSGFRVYGFGGTETNLAQ